MYKKNSRVCVEFNVQLSYQSLRLTESFVLRSRQLLVAAKRYKQPIKT